MELPPDHRARRPRRDDIGALYELEAARDTAIIGTPDLTVDDVAHRFRSPDADPDRNMWLVEGPAGVVGFAGVGRTGDSEIVDVEVIAPDPSVAAWLIDEALHRGAELAAEAGHAAPVVDVGMHRGDDALADLVAARGFAPATSFWRMRIDHDGSGAPPSSPPAPPGVTVRVGPGDVDLLRDAHAVLMASFADHFGWVQLPFDQWRERAESAPGHDWSQLRVVDLQGEPVAMLLGRDTFVADENSGYVANLGVLDAARGRGLARHLLAEAFAEDVRRGRVATMLHVDANNVTPALDLYEGMGMRPVLVFDVWRRPAGSSPG